MSPCSGRRRPQHDEDADAAALRTAGRDAASSQRAVEQPISLRLDVAVSGQPLGQILPEIGRLGGGDHVEVDYLDLLLEDNLRFWDGQPGVGKGARDVMPRRPINRKPASVARHE